MDRFIPVSILTACDIDFAFTVSYASAWFWSLLLEASFAAVIKSNGSLLLTSTDLLSLISWILQTTEHVFHALFIKHGKRKKYQNDGTKPFNRWSKRMLIDFNIDFGPMRMFIVSSRRKIQSFTVKPFFRIQWIFSALMRFVILYFTIKVEYTSTWIMEAVNHWIRYWMRLNWLILKQNIIRHFLKQIRSACRMIWWLPHPVIPFFVSLSMISLFSIVIFSLIISLWCSALVRCIYLFMNITSLHSRQVLVSVYSMKLSIHRCTFGIRPETVGTDEMRRWFSSSTRYFRKNLSGFTSICRVSCSFCSSIIDGDIRSFLDDFPRSSFNKSKTNIYFLCETHVWMCLAPYFARVISIPIDSKHTIALPCSASCLFFSLNMKNESLCKSPEER